jgi:hypothetical protein
VRVAIAKREPSRFRMVVTFSQRPNLAMSLSVQAVEERRFRPPGKA